MVTRDLGFRLGAAVIVPLVAFACSSGGDSAGDGNTGGTAATTGSGNGAGQGGASSASSSSVVASVSSSSAAVGTGGFGGGPAQFVCDPPAEPGSLYERSAASYDINDIDPVSMCKYRGQVALIVNTAAA